MFTADFLSKHPGNDVDSPNEIIPIVFMPKQMFIKSEKMDSILLMIDIENHWSRFLILLLYVELRLRKF